MNLDNTPIIVGLGFYMNQSEVANDCPEPFEMMLAACRDAAKDAVVGMRAGAEEKILASVQSIAVQQGMWTYSNPSLMLAESLGCPNARTELADLGILQLTPLFELCQRIADGEQDVGLLTGGEAKFRELRSNITGEPVSNTEQAPDTPTPDVHHVSQDGFAADVEARAEIFMPVDMFAVIESALRHQKGRDLEGHRDDLAELYAQFSGIAAENPHAWQRTALSAEEIRNPLGKNAMLAYPYTKKHNTQWNVNQAVAILVCSVSKARELGLSESNWIYPLAAARSNHTVCLAQQASLHTRPGTRMIGERVFELAKLTPDDLDLAELYSCFPSSVQSFAKDLALPGGLPLSVTGSMAFAGGPYNHSALDGIARMAEVLRECDNGRNSNSNRNSRVGLVSNLSGVFGKTGVVLLSNKAGEQTFQFDDISAEVAELDAPLATTLDYSGPATIAGYTVSYNKQGPARALVYCDLPDGSRTVVQSKDAELMQQMMTVEHVGAKLTIAEDQSINRVII